MSWGTKIVIAFIGFIGFIGYMVVQTFQVNIDLEADDYYQQELSYQDQIDKKNNLAALGEPMALKQVGEAVQVQLPSSLAGVPVQGTVFFKRPQDKTFDRTYTLEPNAQGLVSIPTSDLLTGQYKVQLDWTASGKAYYFEQSLFVQ